METTKTPGRWTLERVCFLIRSFLRDRASWRYLLCRTSENRCLCDLFFTVHRSSMDNHWPICMEVTRTSGRCTQETVWLLIRPFSKRPWASSAVTRKGKSFFVRLAVHCSSIENLHQCSQYGIRFDSPLSIESGVYTEKRAKMNESYSEQRSMKNGCSQKETKAPGNHRRRRLLVRTTVYTTSNALDIISNERTGSELSNRLIDVFPFALVV